MPRELELKVELSQSDVARLASELPVSDLAVSAPVRKKIRSVYFDTPDHDLHAAGISLRLRRQDGGWLQTVKAEQFVEDGVSNPIELQVELDGAEPNLSKIADEKIKRKVCKAAKASGLRPVFETIVQRTTRQIRAEGSDIELAVDDGEVRAGGAREEVREAELELKAGSAEGLLLAAEKLLAGHELKLGARSKAERGYRLALGKKASALESVKARPVRLRRKDSCAQAMTAILASATQQILANREVVLKTDDPNGAHQMRIGLRRLRSGLRVLRPLVNRVSLRAFEGSARDTSRGVGMLRDADVLISGLHAPVEAAATDKTGFAELHEALTRNRQAKRDEVRIALMGPTWAKLQLYLTLWPLTLAEDERLAKPVLRHARKVLAKTWKKCAKLGRRLDHLDAEKRHEMRKSLKQLRYQTEFFAPLFGKATTHRFLDRLKSLQDVFGYINDVRMAPRLIEVQRQQNAGGEALRAAAYAMGRHEAEAAHVWRAAGDAWGKLTRTRRFWD
jgi:inorganic triphosphatase YgiF